MRLFFFLAIFAVALINAHAEEINYNDCRSIREIIERETKEISTTLLAEHDELAQLYVSRGESYLLSTQYNEAIEDFQKALFHMSYCHEKNISEILAFRVAFGKVVAYDNLGMPDDAQQALDQLRAIVDHVGCGNCIEHQPCQKTAVPLASQRQLKKTIPSYCLDIIKTGNQYPAQAEQDNYNDILGPDRAPEPGWCEEIVTGVGRAMDAIACLAPSYSVKVVLIGIIEAFITRGVKCCQAGDFWKACVAPITRKWKEWKNNKEEHIFPNSQNLPFYID